MLEFTFEIDFFFVYNNTMFQIKLSLLIVEFSADDDDTGAISGS